MLDRTDRHFRYFLRLITRHALLYTEMVTTGALLRSHRSEWLEFDQREKPLALQVGGSDPSELAQCAAIAEDYAFDEINLNVGCPSDRVQNGRFGACLMAEPERVADCVQAMSSRADLPVTVKTRIGIDERDSYEQLAHFIKTVAEGGCRAFIIHARKAWLKGLSPKENREIPPLRYEMVHQLKQDFPDLEIILNGGIISLDQAERQLERLDGVMIGREAYHNPYMLASADLRFYGDSHPVPSREQVLLELAPYVAAHLERGGGLHSIARHILGLFHAVPGARAWRRYLSAQALKKGADVEALLQAAAKMAT